MNASLTAREPVARYLATPPLLQHFDRVAQAPGGVARLRELILTLAVQGKLVPQDPADEPASVLLERIRAEKVRLVKEGKIRKEKPLAAISEEEKPFALPASWEWVRGATVYSIIRGVTYQKDDASASPDEKLCPILRANNIRGSVNFDDLVYVPKHLISAEQQLLEGDFVVCLASGSKNLVGKVAVFLGNLECSFGAFCGAIRPVFRMDFLGVYFASPLYRNAVSEASAGIGINNLKSTSLQSLAIPIPPLAEQSRIVARVEELMALCDALEEKGRLAAAQHERLAGALFDALANSASAEEAADHWQRIAAHFDLLLDRPAAVDRLEQAILQLAVRGRLVPQNPADEPASALLQKIRTEKDRLIANGQLRRDKPLPPISDEEKPFELPEGWEWVRFREVFDGGSGTTPLRAKTHFFEDGTEMWVKTTDLNNAIVTTCEELITKTAVIENRLNYYPAGSVCIAMYGGSGTIGKSGILGVASTINQSVFALPPTKGIDSHFVHIYVITIRNKWMGFAAGLRKDPNINGQIIKNMLFPLPPLAEQSRIVARVAELRALCAQLRDRLATTAQTRSRLAEALLEQAVA